MPDKKEGVECNPGEHHFPSTDTGLLPCEFCGVEKATTFFDDKGLSKSDKEFIKSDNMETNKMKAIREAYGEHWEKVKNRLSSDWWFTPYHMENSQWATFASENNWDVYGQSIRPKSLQGIENNNGWFSIEEHGLPYHPTKEYETGILNENGFSMDNGICLSKQVQYRYEKRPVKITHYRPIEQVKPPLY